VYDLTLESWFHSVTRDAEQRKKQREYMVTSSCPELPVAGDRAIVAERARFVGRDSMAGLRGMYNLGNTSVEQPEQH
jgi:hypothetical protein